MSPGFRSTEFWQSTFASACGAFLCALAVLGRDALAWPGVALLGASVFSYGHSRGKAKGRPYLPPGGRL